ncbi:MAG: hypothetical protein IJQ13_02915 [Prevotella sp.]|nr:hypothetical protein [Prevotella sp.]
MPKYSDHLKAVLYPGSFLENGRNVEKKTCSTIQHFAYQCQRSRNDAGFPYGETTPTEMVFTIRLGHPDDGKVFYQQMQSNELFEHTFIFNATFGPFDRLESYEDAMVVKGYVVDVNEDYDTAVLEDGTMNQIRMKVTLLLSSITYTGKEEKGNRLLEITHY